MSLKTKLVIFGFTGDLSRRKLLPALSKIIQQRPDLELDIIGVSRGEVDIDELLSRSLGDDAPILADHTTVFTMDIAKASGYHQLALTLDLQSDEQMLVYLAVPPQASTQIVDHLGEANFGNTRIKILFEKPFGVDLASAEDMIARTARYFHEDQLYRIDHYLAKEMAQNIVVFRGDNALFSTIWNRLGIDHIDIIATETIDIKGRAGFYEQTGALRDIVQGHLMQLLALTLMDIPEHLDWDSLPELRLDALRHVQSVEVSAATRAQYDGYGEDAGNPGSLTETFVALTLQSDADAWRGVPIRLITGKALDRKTTEIRVYLKKTRAAQQNQITFHIQPDEGVDIRLVIKKPGYAREFETQNLGFHFPDDTLLPDAYEQVVVDAIESKKSLFTSSDEVLESWRILAPIQYAWSMDNLPPQLYKKGVSFEAVVSDITTE